VQKVVNGCGPNCTGTVNNSMSIEESEDEHDSQDVEILERSEEIEEEKQQEEEDEEDEEEEYGAPQAILAERWAFGGRGRSAWTGQRQWEVQFASAPTGEKDRYWGNADVWDKDSDFKNLPRPERVPYPTSDDIKAMQIDYKRKTSKNLIFVTRESLSLSSNSRMRISSIRSESPSLSSSSSMRSESPSLSSSSSIRSSSMRETSSLNSNSSLRRSKRRRLVVDPDALKKWPKGNDISWNDMYERIKPSIVKTTNGITLYERLCELSAHCKSLF
jgi:hypothetical protein